MEKMMKKENKKEKEEKKKEEKKEKPQPTSDIEPEKASEQAKIKPTVSKSSPNMPAPNPGPGAKADDKSAVDVADFVANKDSVLPIKQGWIRIRTLRVWKKRWFSLYANGLLLYYRSSKVPLPPCSGKVER